MKVYVDAKSIPSSSDRRRGVGWQRYYAVEMALLSRAAVHAAAADAVCTGGIICSWLNERLSAAAACWVHAALQGSLDAAQPESDRAREQSS
jgi:hypothetical protein